MPNFTLCTFSKSEIYETAILAECPLGLNRKESTQCPCRRREYHVPPADLRLLTCTYPETWRGEPIRDPDALAKSLTAGRKCKTGKDHDERPKRKARPQTRSSDPMTTASANAAPEDDRPPKPEKASKALTTAAAAGLSVYNRIGDPVQFIGMIGKDIYDSKMFGCSNVAQGRVLALMFMVEGVNPFNWKARNHVIGGNVTMSAEAMLADLRTDRGGTHRIVSRTPDKAAIELTIGKQKQLFEFTWAEARLEDYVYNSAGNDGKVPKTLPDGSPNPAALKDNWKTPRRRMQMLWARVVSDAVGAMTPEVAGGKLTPEELGVMHDEATLATSSPIAQPPPAAGEVVDGEFEVKQESTGAAAAAATPDGAAQDASGSSPAAGEGSELRRKPESPPFEPQSAGLTVPAADADQPAQVLTGPAPAAADQKKALLRELKALKEELLTPQQYAKVIDSKGVKSAVELDLPQLEKLVSGLRTRKAQKAGTDALSQWAEGAVKPRQATEGGPPGNFQ